MKQIFMIMSLIAIIAGTVHNFEAPFIILTLYIYALFYKFKDKIILSNTLFILIFIFMFLQWFEILHFNQHFMF